MEITEVKVFPVREDKLKAFVSVVFDGCFMVNDIKVIQGRDGFFISMPSRKKKNGKFKDVAHPLNNETRQKMEKRILGEYEVVLNQGGDSSRPQSASPDPDPASGATQTEPEPATALSDDRSREEPPEGEDKSLEEVTELHLRDSFWNT